MGVNQRVAPLLGERRNTNYLAVKTEAMMSEYDCPNCRKTAEFRLPSSVSSIMRGLYAGISKPSRALGVLSGSIPDGLPLQCNECDAIAGKCPQCETLSLGGAVLSCRNCGLEFCASI